MKFALICPSRERPHRFTTMQQSARETAARPDDVCVYGVLDSDDPALAAYFAQTPLESAVDCAALQWISQGKRELLSVAFQRGAERALHDGADVLMMCGDDVLFRTPGWDDKVRAAFPPDGLALVYPADGNGNKGLHDGDVRCNHWFVTRRWIEVVGCFCPTVFEHFCSDTVPERIAQLAGRMIHLPDVLVEHMHFKHLKSQKDATYTYARERDAQGRSMSDRDVARMHEMEPWIRERAATVRAAIA